MSQDAMLTEIEMAASELRRLGLGSVRVCGREGAAWLQASRADLAAITCDPLRGAVVRAVLGAGFERVALDLEGY